MSNQISLNHDRKIIIAAITGEENFESIIYLLGELMEEPYLSLPYGVVIDFRNADLSGLKYDNIHEIVKHLMLNSEKVHIFNLAILTSGTLEYGLNRMFQILSSEALPFKVLVTYDEADAYEWAESSCKIDG